MPLSPSVGREVMLTFREMNASDLRTAAGDLRGAVGSTTRRDPPRETSKRLITLRRDDGDVRGTWDEYEGRLYLSIRLWTRGTDGNLYHDKAWGITVRVREIPDFADGVAAAVDEARSWVTARHGTPSPAPRTPDHDDGMDGF